MAKWNPFHLSKRWRGLTGVLQPLIRRRRIQPPRCEDLQHLHMTLLFGSMPKQPTMLSFPAAAGSSVSMCVGGFQLGSPATPDTSQRIPLPDDAKALLERTLHEFQETHRNHLEHIAGLLHPIQVYVNKHKLAETLAKETEECNKKPQITTSVSREMSFNRS